ncbi:hypothetical protein M5E85_11145 [Roseburia intestinalis]|uniref:hypothetical protein n=2 Tax=Roseburia intestinalis TaxID=166486 RepID=UPI00201B7522|nr:hypothetical protein [Roseburia intestinalis]UQT29256.1 hypothetical protein M5E85_11145 [Roseburia intestinalis]
MASQLGLPLVPDTNYYYPRFYLGLPEGEKRELGEIISCDLCFDGRYYAVSGKCLVDREDFICYDVVTRTSLSLGDRVTYEGRELLVSRKKTELAGGEVIFTYRLAGNSYTWVPWEDNPDYTGMSFVGSIVGTQGEQVEVAFDIDKTAAGGNRYGFAPATGNLMYCMPQKGTKTSLYIGNGDEAQGIATGCIRTNGSTCEGTGSPEKKSFRSEHGKGMDLYPQRMGLDGGETGKITFEDETGTTIESNGGLVLMAKEGIRLESMTRIAMQGMSDIMALYSEGASSFCVNGSVDMLGRRTSLAGTVYQGYDPFEDVPQKGEFDWGGFARNLVMGLAVGAACIALAVFLPGIGTVAAGALFGAGMGAISASVAGAVSDYSSGNVRSLGEATKDMVISMITGAITGAIGAAFPAVKWFGEGLIDVGSGILTRGMYALLNPDMSTEEKLAYVFDLKQMGVDFITGVAMHFASKGVTAIKSKLTWNKSGTTTLQTGGRQIDYNAYIKRLETIDMEYENIRIDTTDISKIAQNTGMPEWKISRIKDHVFSNEHILDAGVKRFDADPEIADAWYRLTNGTYNQNDIDLLNHEYFESKFESFYKTDYRTAHNKTEESGRIWDPYKENN